MQKIKRPLHQIVHDLNEFIQQKNLTQAEFSKFIKDNIEVDRKISQSQISRILDGSVRRYSKNLEYLCKFSGVEMYHERKEDKEGRRMVDACIDELWDGSREQARKLVKLLRGVQPLLGDK